VFFVFVIAAPWSDPTLTLSQHIGNTVLFLIVASVLGFCAVQLWMPITSPFVAVEMRDGSVRDLRVTPRMSRRWATKIDDVIAWLNAGLASRVEGSP